MSWHVEVFFPGKLFDLHHILLVGRHVRLKTLNIVGATPDISSSFMLLRARDDGRRTPLLRHGTVVPRRRGDGLPGSSRYRVENVICHIAVINPTWNMQIFESHSQRPT